MNGKAGLKLNLGPDASGTEEDSAGIPCILSTVF
jgi:hypothetical protein